MVNKNKEWQATLLDPTALGKFLSPEPGWEQQILTPLHPWFQINPIEVFRPYLKFPLAPHRKTVYDFLFLTAGSTTRNKGIDNYTLGPNSFFFLPAYQILTSEAMSEDVRGYYCHFDPEIFNKKFIQSDLFNEFNFLKYNGHPVVTISDEAVPIIEYLLNRLVEEYRTGRKESLDLIRSYLLTLFYELRRFSQHADVSSNDSAAQLTQRYKEALPQQVYTFQKVSDFAKYLNVSPNYLNRCVQRTMGKSAHDLLNETMLLESKALLKQSALSISEIAYKVGKKDPSDFSRFFKAQTGMTPKEYRE